MTKSMTSGNPAKLLLLFAIPVIFGNMFQQLYSIVDTIIVGRALGVHALAAVGCTGSITFLVLGFVNGFTQGLAIITSQRFGAEDEEGVKNSFAASILLSISVVIIMTIAAMLLANTILQALKTPDDIIHDAYIYLQINFFGIFAPVFFNMFSSMIRALGDSKRPLYFLITACFINIILDLIFVCIFHMGVAGAAWATIIAQSIAALFCLFHIKKHIPQLQLEKRHFQTVGNEWKEHLVFGLPMAFQMSIIAIGSMILQSALNSLGAISVAAYTAAQKIDSIATMPLSSFGAAISTYTAQNYGAGKIERIKKGVFQCILLSVGFSIFMGILNVTAGGQMASVFVGNGEKEVLELAKQYLIINGVSYWILSLLFIYRLTLQGLGQSIIPTVTGIMELVMRILGAWVLVQQFGFAGAAASNALAWVGGCLPGLVAYYVTMHKMRKQE